MVLTSRSKKLSRVKIVHKFSPLNETSIVVSQVQDSILYVQLTSLDSNKGVKGVPLSIAV